MRGEGKLAGLACSGSLAPRFVNNDYATAEIVIALRMRVVRRLLGLGLLCAVRRVSLTWESPEGLCAVMLLCCSLLWMMRQPAERLCYGFHAREERINASAVPTAPLIFFQPLILRLALPWSSEQGGQCEQQDSWRHKQHQQYTWLEIYVTN